jgi:hypothetical protein
VGSVNENFTLTSNEMEKILKATTNMQIYNVIKTPLNKKDIKTAFCSTNPSYTNGVIGLKYSFFDTICNDASLSFEETNSNCPDPDSGADLGAEELDVKTTYGIDNYSPGDDVISLINSATSRINSFLEGSFCTNAGAYSVFGLCGACGVSDPTTEFCGNCQGITLTLLGKEVKPTFGSNNFIWGSTKDFYKNIINANDEELWKMIYEPFLPLWDDLKPNPDAVWNYSNKQLTLNADGTGYNFCQGLPPI